MRLAGFGLGYGGPGCMDGEFCGVGLGWVSGGLGWAGVEWALVMHIGFVPYVYVLDYIDIG